MKPYTIFDITLEDDDEGVYCVSFVDKPAIGVDYVKLADTEEIKLEIISEEKRIVTGPVLIPNKLIYREDEFGTPFYINFSSEIIEKLRNKFHSKDLSKSTNVQHNGVPINSNYTIESYIISENLKDNRFDLPIGTWILSYKVEDDKVWNKIKSGKLKGFSIEALVNFKPTNKKAVNMSIVEKLETHFKNILDLFKPEEVKLEDVSEEPTQEPTIEDSGLVAETINTELAEVVESEVSSDKEEMEDEEGEYNRLNMEIESLLSKIEELEKLVEEKNTDNEFLKSELAKQKDYSALNLSKVSSDKEVKGDATFNYFKRYLKNEN